MNPSQTNPPPASQSPSTSTAEQTSKPSSTATVAKVDIDENQQLAAAYGVRGVPTLVLFADGEHVAEVVGVQPADQLRALIETHAA